MFCCCQQNLFFYLCQRYGSPKNEISVVIYSKPVWVSSVEHKRRYFEKCRVTEQLLVAIHWHHSIFFSSNFWMNYPIGANYGRYIISNDFCVCICRKRVRRQMIIWERLKSRVCWARLWGSVWRPPDMNMNLRHRKHSWGWATKPKCCGKRDILFTEGKTIRMGLYLLSFSIVVSAGGLIWEVLFE